MGKCKHLDVRQWFYADPLRDNYSCVQHRCGTCDATLPIGPSNDDSDDVVTEMRAADLAAKRLDEGAGWGDDRFDYCPLNQDDRLCLTCESHYLASVIVNHRDDTP